MSSDTEPSDVAPLTMATPMERRNGGLNVAAVVMVGIFLFIILAALDHTTAVITTFAIAGASLLVFCWSLTFSRKGGLWGACLTIFVISSLLGMLSIAVHKAREAALISCLGCHLKQMAVAFLNYRDEHGRFPPAYTTDSQGKPLQSWRALILRQIEEGELSERLDLTKPWNDPANAEPASQSISTYRGPWEERTFPNHTNFVAVLGRDTVWGVDLGVEKSEITDDPGETIMLVEMKKSGIPWAEPRDLDWENLPPSFDKQNYMKLLSNHSTGLYVAFADGSVKLLPPDLPLEVFEAMLTKSGGEKINPAILP
jgi:prepilin-type processing-associated H-X9-DG protein